MTLLNNIDAKTRDWLTRLVHSNPEWLTRDLIRRIRQNSPETDTAAICVTAALVILHEILGPTWVERHMYRPEAKTDHFFKPRTKGHEYRIGMMRTIHLAEMVVNLRAVPGFPNVIKHLIAGRVEDRFAELEVGKFLRRARQEFEFVEPTLERGSDYDLRIKVGQHIICADTKCRLETTAEGADGLLKRLKNGRAQLPADRPGAIFVRLPQTWNPNGADFDRHEEMLEQVAQRFFRNTGRVVSVIFYFSLALPFDEHTTPVYWASEHHNPSHRFGSIESIRLYPEGSPPTDWFDIALMADPEGSQFYFSDEITKRRSEIETRTGIPNAHTESYSQEEIQRRAEAAIVRTLNTPPRGLISRSKKATRKRPPKSRRNSPG